MRSQALLNAENKSPLVSPPLSDKGTRAMSESAQERFDGVHSNAGFSFGEIKLHSDNVVSSSPHRVRPKLTINQPDDKYEQEADAMADKVMRMPNRSLNQNRLFTPAISIIQSKCAPCEEEEKKVHRKESGTSTMPATSPAMEQTLQSTGQPMDRSTQSFMEERFQYDFSNVIIHNDSLAHLSSANINAHAYTCGNHVVFGAEQYQPNASSGKRLLAHELTHVIQQKANLIRRKHTNQVGNSGVYYDYEEHGIKASAFCPYAEYFEKALPDYVDYCTTRGKVPKEKTLKANLEKSVEIVNKINPSTALKIKHIVSGSYAQLAIFNGNALVILTLDELLSNKFKATLSHEAAHAVFEYHLTENKGKPDNFSLQIADIYLQLHKTKLVPLPTAKYTEKGTKPSLKEDQNGQPSGLVMIDDILWSGFASHFGATVHEFFASALGGYSHNKSLFTKILKHYYGADPKIKPLAKQLIKLLSIVSDKRKIKRLTTTTVSAPADINAEITSLRAIQDYTQGSITQNIDDLLGITPRNLYNGGICK